MPDNQGPFSDLPAALLEDVLKQSESVGHILLASFQNVREGRANFRKSLLDHNLLVNESTLGYPPLPTTCATDGSYAIERLLTADLAAAASVAVEGLTPPSEKRFWEQPCHSTFVVAEAHHAETATILRAVMLGRELLLAVKAPHDLVMLDMTLTLPIIYFNQALTQIISAPDLHCAKEFKNNCCSYLEAYLAILRAERSDKNFIALPKYSTRREIGKALNWPPEHDDRGLLTMLLQAGELTKPHPLEQPEEGKWHLNTLSLPDEVSDRAKALAAEIVAQLGRLQIFYYKPHQWLPALRVEAASDIATNNHRLSTVIQGLKHQCATSAMLEPYPLYLADRTVKALAKSVPAFRQVATQRISESYEGDIGEVFFAMHGYRTEAGG